MLGRYYSEGEFDLSRLAHLRDTTVEAGRACIDAQYRGGAVLLLLWSGLADYMRAQRCDYLIGCASISLADGGVNAAAIYAGLGADQCAPAELSVTPHLPFPMRAPAGVKATLPPLLRGYLRSGALVELLPQLGGATRPFILLFPHARHLSLRVRTFVDFLVAKLGRAGTAVAENRP